MSDLTDFIISSRDPSGQGVPRSGRSALSLLVDGMIGKPFRWGARGPDAYYCMGCYLELLRRAAGIELEDPILPDPEPETQELAAIAETNEARVERMCRWRRFLEHFEEIPLERGGLRPLDALVSRTSGRSDDSRRHILVVEDDHWAVSANEAWVERMPMSEALRRAEAAYRPKALATEKEGS